MEVMLLHDDKPQLTQNQSFDANPAHFGSCGFLQAGTARSAANHSERLRGAPELSL